MKKILTLLLALGAFFAAEAQTVQIGTGSSISPNTLYGPLYRLSATSTTTAARCDMLWTQAEMAAAGIPAGAQILSIEFNKANAANFVTPATFKIYMGNTSNTALATTQTWAAITTNFTQVFNSTSYNMPAAPGWVSMPVTPFTYTGGALEIATDLAMTGNGGATDKFQWEYTSTTAPDKIVGASTAATTLNGTTAGYKFRPNIRINYSTGACNTPPTAGTTTASVTGNVCPGTYVTLGLSGYTSGSGQTYQLQSAPTATGTYTNVGAAGSIPFAAITPAVSTWYRYSVICGAASSTSVPVQVVVNVPVAGTFTINSAVATGGTNFQTFNAALSAMACGIGGPVVFNVSSGTYNEQVIIPAIAGSSAANTVTFNGNGATLTFASAATAERATLKLNGADYIRVNNLKIITTGTYGIGIHLTNDADNNIINACNIYSDTTATSTNFAGVSISGSANATTTGSDCDSNKIFNNTINGGYYGVTVFGDGTTSRINGNQVKGNTITNFYYYGIYVNGNDGLVIDSNNISRPTRTNVSVFQGINLNDGNIGTRVSRNRIHHSATGDPTNTSTQYAINITGDGTAAKPNVFSNNLIYDMNGLGITYGIYKSGADYTQILHNTISLDYLHASPPSTAAYGFYQTTTHSGLDFSNNIISLGTNTTGNRYCIYVNTATATYTGNNNVLYLSGTSGTPGIGYYAGAAASTLAAWRTATGQDAASSDLNPLFTAAASGNFKPQSAQIDNIGRVAGILTDITGAARSANTPDAGAYEFTAGGCVSPPTAGTTTSSANGGVCNGVTVAIGLSGNSIGAGQTYQLQSAPTATGTYSNMGLSSTAPSGTVTATASLWYRYEVTCGAASATSTPVQVIVNTLLPGGTYTINGAAATGGTNFQTFNAAVNAISCGTTGAVVFNVLPGTYNEQVIIPNISTNSAINTITFNGGGATLTNGVTTTTERATLKLDGADYIRVNNLKIITTGTTYGIGIHLTNDANNNLINGCMIYSDTTATSTGFAGISISGAASSTATLSDCDSNVIANNSINGGYYSITVMGNGVTSRISGNKITGNTLTNFYNYGIYLNGLDGIVVDSNDMSRPTRTNNSTFYPVYITTGVTGASISRNRIHNSNDGEPANTSAQYGIYISADGTAAKPNIISNNLVYNINGPGIVYGIYKSGADNVKILHNTLSLDYQHATAPSTAVYGFYQTATHTDLDFSNNIISLSRNSTGNRYCVYVATTAATYGGNNNVFYLAGTSGTSGIGYYAANAQLTLADWRTATGQDAASIAANPSFTAPVAGDFKPLAAVTDNIGRPMGILTDITGAARSTATPDPGAYEYVAGGCVSPPTAGATTSSATGGVCSGTVVTIALSGNSIGTGQAYQLQSAPTATGTYTNVGASVANATGTVTINATQWYRYAVTCGTATAYSTPVQVVMNPALSGIYTINSAVATSGTNFQTFNAAVNAMACGVNGPVTFNVTAGSGPYNEQVIIPAISGASSVNKITFNGNGATLTYAATASAERATLKLDGADQVTFNNLKIIATGATYGIGVQMLNDADNNTISGCNIYTDTTATGTGFAGIAISGSATSATTVNSNCDSISLINNTVNGGYYGITLLGNGTTSQIVGNKITGNTISNFYYYGIYVGGNDGLLMESNDITRPTRTNNSVFQGIYINTGNIGLKISRNRVHNSSPGEASNTSAQYGIYLLADGTPGKPNSIINNAIYDFNGAGTAYGIYKSGGDNTTIQHNTISMDYIAASPVAAVTYGFYQTLVHTGLDFSNNMVTVSRNSTGNRYCVYINTATATFNGNYNNYYIGGTSGTYGIGYYNGAAQATLAGWRTATGQDANSLSLDPAYVSLTNGNLKPTNMQLDNRGLNVGVLTDIVNEARVLPPDIGAFEFGSDCAVASGLTAAPITGNSATITWTAVAGAQGYEYVLDRVNASPAGAGTPIAAASYNATNLSPLTTYYFHVRIKCPAGGYSYWATLPFTTLCFIANARITVAGDTLICPNAPVTLSADTGADLTYQWNLNGTPIPSATAVNYMTATPGAYTVTEMMGSCSKTSDTVHIVVDTRLLATIAFSGTSTICEGGRLMMMANTGTGFVYQWYRNGLAIPTATGSNYVAEYNGSYKVRITAPSAPCPAVSDSVTVIVNANPVPQIVRTGSVLSTSSPFTTYQWYRNGQPIAGATAATYIFNRDGNYTVVVTDGNTCTAQSSRYLVNYLNIGSVQASDISIYPNPATNLIHISSPVPVSAAIHSVDGRQVIYEEQAKEMDIHQLSSGAYLLYIRDKDNQVLKIEKLLKK